MPKTQRNIRFDDDLWEALAAYALKTETSVTDLLERGGRLVLDEKKKRPARTTKLKTEAAPAVLPPTSKSGREYTRELQREAKDRCRRETCRHAKASHWAKGCLAGCNCNLSRFLKET
jgi:hypothetical protein